MTQRGCQRPVANARVPTTVAPGAIDPVSRMVGAGGASGRSCHVSLSETHAAAHPFGGANVHRAFA